MNLRLVIVTCPSIESARTLAEAMLERRLIACANLIPSIESIYRWKGAIEKSSETLLLLKTVENQIPALETALVEAHPYEIPEFVVLTPTAVHSKYAQWVAGSL